MKRIHAWLSRISLLDRPWTWLGFAGMLLSATPFYLVSGSDIASGLGVFADTILYYSAMLAANVVGSYVIGGILLLIRAKLPRIFAGGVIVQFAILFTIFYVSKVNWLGASLLSLIIMLVGFLLGAAFSIWLFSKRSEVRKAIFLIAACTLFIGFFCWLFVETPQISWTDQQRETAARLRPLPLQAPDPGLPGEHDFYSFTYGSGQDRQRARFAERAEVVTRTVDGSAIIKDWDWSREWLWGYGIEELPLNGTVWMPTGEGPHPLALIVHGNHSMADFSDSGYQYLGEQLASQGYIVVSVDQNFINHSTWEGGLDSLSEDMTIRAWLLLQHLIELERLTMSPDNPFSGRIDMGNITLIGHSRGGQAAILAANFDQFFYEDEYEAYRINRTFHIENIVAIAPTDMVIYNRNLMINNVNYLLLQGSNDADVNTFAGDRQYKRIAYPGGSGFFKTSLYIKGANHGQFNTEWGRGDITHPIQLFLNDAELITGEEQRMIAKVYITAFLDAVSRDDSPYVPMFQDYRYALKWLPNTKYVSRYMDSGFKLITDAEEDRDKEEGRRGAMLSVSGMNTWVEEDLRNRNEASQANRVIRLDPDQAGASFVIEFDEQAPHLEQRPIEAFTFAMGVLSGDKSKVRSVTIQFTDQDGATARTTLDRFVPVPGPIETQFLKIPWLEKTIRDGGLSTSAEPVLQTYVIPIADWIHDSSEFDSSRIRQIMIRFEYPGRGKGDIMLDEIGYYVAP